MAVNPAPTATGNGLKNVIDTIIAPNEAFESIGIAPTWGWAFLITIVLIAISGLLNTPAYVHAFTADWPAQIAKNPRLAALSADQQATQLAVSLKFIPLAWIVGAIFCPLFFLLYAVIMTIFNATGRGVGSFAKYWAASCNIGIIVGIGAIVLSVIVMVRGTSSFDTMQSIQNAMPSAALFAQGGGVKAVAFLSTFTPFTLWATWLTVQALLTIGRVPKLHAWLGGLVGLLVPALFALAFAR